MRKENKHFKEIAPDTLKKLREVQLEILKEIDRICKKNNIEYFLIYGTLLGSIRHKGFIPWDDDLDIGLTRDNYNKFLEACMKDLDSSYFLDYLKTNENYHLPFAKIRKNNTTFVEENAEDLMTHKGIYVDIFPLDRIKNRDSLLTKFKVITIRTLIETVFLKKKMHENAKFARHPLYVRLLSILSLKNIFKLEDYIVKSLSNDKGNYYISLFGSYPYKKDCFKIDKLFPLQDVTFEGKTYKAFKDYDYVLKSLYGNYMTLPPIDKRVNHGALEIDFQEGCNCNLKKR